MTSEELMKAVAPVVNLQETHCGWTLSQIRQKLNLTTTEMHYTLDGVRGVFTDEQGESYEIVIKPYKIKEEGR